jgi:hypothetical protein
LAGAYLKAVEAGRPLQPFFGSWYDLQGYKQTGYYLGHEVVKLLVESGEIYQVGVQVDYQEVMQAVLLSFANK